MSPVLVPKCHVFVATSKVVGNADGLAAVYIALARLRIPFLEPLFSQDNI